MLNNKLYVSTGAFKEKNLNKILKECQTTGFQCLELSSGIKFSNLLRDKCKELDGEMSFLIHNYFPAPSKPFLFCNKTTCSLLLNVSVMFFIRTSLKIPF